MGFFQTLFSKRRAEGGALPSDLVQMVEAKLSLVQHLAECHPLTREGMTKYIALLEQSGVDVPPQKQRQMLDANSLVMPQPQADGTVADGYEQLRRGFLSVHLEELTEAIKVLKQLPATSGAVDLLKRVMRVTDKL